MSYTNYKKISYILSEKPGLSGQIAFEFLDKIIIPNDVLKFTFNGHGNSPESFDYFKNLYDDVVFLNSKNNEEEILIKNFNMKDGLHEVLGSLGKFPNFCKISKSNYCSKIENVDCCWCIEYCDEIFTFIYMDKCMDDLKIALIEQELLNKGLLYEKKQKNIFGDVIVIYNNLGALQCRYEYDAWGNHKVYNASGSEISAEVLNIGNINPIRYRGYYWDKEFGLYYLQSRYYDPALGRFISADSVEYLEPNDIIGLNLYAYCYDNPIMYYVQINIHY